MGVTAADRNKCQHCVFHANVTDDFRSVTGHFKNIVTGDFRNSVTGFGQIFEIDGSL